MRKFFCVSLIVFAISMTGCAKFWNDVDRNGSLIGSTNGDWVVINYSGGKIMDVWKLTNVMVQSEEHSDGWLFKDSKGNMVNIGGDAKAVRILNKTADWDKYQEYHAEFETLSYQEKFNK